MENQISALIISQPGPLRDGLKTILLGVNHLETIHQVGDISSVPRAIRKHRPALVLLDADLPGNEASVTVRMIKAEGAHCGCLVLADNVRQQKEAQSAGADIVLLKGFPAAKLIEIIESFLRALIETA